MIRKNNIQNILTTSTLFLIGAVTMILELTGSRIVAPYFGTTIFTWTSLIGTILGSLSIGYWLGGKLADKKISLRILSRLLFTNSLICFGLYLFSNEILQLIFIKFKDIASGVFISSIVLFSLPSIILGMIPPYIAKFNITSLNTSGTSIGNLYAISTVGSIFGTFLAGYYLLSTIGSYEIILLLSLILNLNSLLLDRKFIVLQILLFCVLIFTFIVNEETDYFPKESKVLDSINTAYATYYVVEENSRSGRIRKLMSDLKGAQSAYAVGNKSSLIVNYTKYFTLPACYNQNNNVLMIGGGGFSYAKYFIEHFPKHTLDIVEIDSALTKIAEDYFELPSMRPNINIITADGRSYLNTNQKRYDAIIIDAYNTYSMPFQLVTKEALQEMNRSLSQKGLIIINIISPIENGKPNLLKTHYNTFSSLFPKVEIYKVRTLADLDVKQNIILIAYKETNQETLADCLFKQEGLYRNKIDIIPQVDIPVLVDDFAPIEYL